MKYRLKNKHSNSKKNSKDEKIEKIKKLKININKNEKWKMKNEKWKIKYTNRNKNKKRFINKIMKNKD